MRGLKAPISTSPSLMVRKWQPPASCVLYLPGQDDAYSSTIRDRSGKNNHGTITGATWIKNSKGLWVLSCDGDDYVQVTHNTNLAISSGGGAVLMWMVIAAKAGSDSPFCVKRAAALRDYDIFCATSSDGASRKFGNYNGAASVFSTTALSSTTAWYFVGIGFSAGTTYLWLNGEPDGSGAQAAGTANAGNLQLMGQTTTPSYCTNGSKMGITMMLSTLPSDALVRNIFRNTRHLYGV